MMEKVISQWAVKSKRLKSFYNKGKCANAKTLKRIIVSSEASSVGVESRKGGGLGPFNYFV